MPGQGGPPLPLDDPRGYGAAIFAALLGGLWVFHAPFPPRAAVAIFDPQDEYPEGQHSPILDRLDILWRRGLLAREVTTLHEGRLLLYRLPPALRPYAERYIPQALPRDELLVRFGAAYAGRASAISQELNRDTTMVYLAQQARENLERGLAYSAKSSKPRSHQDTKQRVLKP